MTKLNIKKGDIPETDQETEKLIAQMEKKAAKKPTVARKNKKVIVLDVAANHEPGQPLPEDAAERAASGSGWQGEEVVEKPAKAKKPTVKKGYPLARASNKRAPKQEAAKPATTTKNGHNRVTEDVAKAVLVNSNNGVAIAEIAKMHNITERRVKSIVAGRTWGLVTGQQYEVKNPRGSNKKASTKDTESVTIDGQAYHVDLPVKKTAKTVKGGK